MAWSSEPRLGAPIGELDHALGPADAPITLVEYGDYECSYCGTSYPVLKELRRRLGSQLRLVFRNFPCLDEHPNAQLAAEAAEAAGAQGKFWEMHDMLFQHFYALERADLMRYATELGLDLEQFECELAANVYAPRVQADVWGGIRSGVNRAPTIFINGVRHGGFLSLTALLEAIEVRAAGGAALRGAPDQVAPR